MAAELVKLTKNRDGYYLVPGLGTQHKLVLRYVFGTDDLPCFWCGKVLRWNAPDMRDTVTADHLNWVRTDNSPDNLVPSCVSCNSKRQQPKPRQRRLYVEMVKLQRRNVELTARLDEARRFIKELAGTKQTLPMPRAVVYRPVVSPVRNNIRGECNVPTCEHVVARNGKCVTHAREWDTLRKRAQRAKRANR